MTKAELAQRVLRLIGVNSRFKSATPEEVQDVLIYADDLLLALDGTGTRLGWVADDGTPDPTQETGLPDWAILGITNSLAITVAPYFEKPIHPSIPRNASIGMQTIMNKTVQNEPIQYPARMPRGQGNRTLYGNRWYPPTDPIITDGDYLTDSGGEVITS